MSNFALNAAWLSSEEDVSCRFVLVALADQANDDGLCWPAVDSIAGRTGLTARSVQRALKKLVAGGHLSFASEREGGRGHTNRYLLHPRPCPDRTAKKEARRVRMDAGKGDTVSALTKIKGDNDDIKGDTASPLENGKGDIDDIKGDIDDIKGDTVSPEPYKNPKEPSTRSGAHTQGGVSPVTEAEAWEFARNLPVMPPWTQQMVGHWFSDREFRGWHTSGDNPQPITAANWRADLRRSHRWAQLAAPVDWKTGTVLPGQGAPVLEKKFTGAAPDWDWQALYRDRFDHEAPEPWEQLHPDIRAELTAMHERRAA